MNYKGEDDDMYRRVVMNAGGEGSLQQNNIKRLQLLAVDGGGIKTEREV